MDPEYQDEDVKIPRVKARVAGFRIVEEKHRYATYRIQVRTKDLPEPHNRWEVFHRYSEFANFHNKIKKLFPPDLELPELPKKTFRTSLNETFLTTRRLQLNEYLRQVLEAQSDPMVQSHILGFLRVKIVLASSQALPSAQQRDFTNAKNPGEVSLSPVVEGSDEAAEATGTPSAEEFSAEEKQTEAALRVVLQPLPLRMLFEAAESVAAAPPQSPMPTDEAAAQDSGDEAVVAVDALSPALLELTGQGETPGTTGSNRQYGRLGDATSDARYVFPVAARFIGLSESESSHLWDFAGCLRTNFVRLSAYSLQEAGEALRDCQLHGAVRVFHNAVVEFISLDEYFRQSLQELKDAVAGDGDGGGGRGEGREPPEKIAAWILQLLASLREEGLNFLAAYDCLVSTRQNKKPLPDDAIDMARQLVPLLPTLSVYCKVANLLPN